MLSRPTPRRSLRRAALAAGVVAVGALTFANVAQAAFSVETLTAQTSPGRAAADPQQAGGYPNLTLGFGFSTLPPMPGGANKLNDGHVGRMTVDLPVGFSGDPTGVTQCDLQVAQATYNCPLGAQVGILSITPEISNFPDHQEPVIAPIYSVDAGSDHEAARLFSPIAGVIVMISISPRSDSDFGLRATVVGMPGAAYSPAAVTMKLWGVPADPINDAERVGYFGQPLTFDDQYNPLPTPSQSPALPFLTNPTACGPAGAVSMTASSYEEPEHEVSARSNELPAITGCDAIPFASAFSFQPDNTKIDSPAGFDAVVTVPQYRSPDSPHSAHVKRVDVVLPRGVAISPAGAAGLEACSDAALQLNTTHDATCPRASSIGSVSVDVPILKAPLKGDVYLRTPQPGHLFRLVLVAKGQGINLKIIGEATPDPQTGQLHAVFENAPQQPFSKLALHFAGGPQAALANPQFCGSNTTAGTVGSWSGADAAVSDAFTTSVDGKGAACPAVAPFAPSVQAGSSSAEAGRSTALMVDVARKDGEQNLRRLDIQLPAGITAKVKDVPLCTAQAGAAGGCAEASRVGSVDVGAGSGSAPLFLPGRVYLTAGYGGAPYGMSIVVPAKVGPFDLGDVVVQARVFVDRKTAALRVISEDIPTILQGVPLRIKDIRIAIDRPDFMLNPTNCSSKSVGATIGAVEGGSATTTVPFAATGCNALPFKPVITAVTSGKRWKGSGSSLKVTVAQPAGQANLGKVKVQLPKQLAARGTTISKACLYDEWIGAGCKPATKAGFAKAVTPILGEPLTGGVYFVTRPKGQAGLPQLRMVLRGGGLEIDLVGDVSVNKQGLTSTEFPAIPDVPISSFEMDLPQGPMSLLASSAGFCGKSVRMPSELTGQNGARASVAAKVSVTGCGPRISSVKSGKAAVQVAIAGVGAGKVRVTGAGLKAVARTSKGARSMAVTVPLTTATRARLKSGRSLKVRVTVAYTPRGASKTQRVQRTVTIGGRA